MQCLGSLGSATFWLPGSGSANIKEEKWFKNSPDIENQ